jgi:acyl-CoA synthetase (AMP-forming)/AMP-acid ligase II
VAVYLEKSCEEAYAIFGISIAGGVIVPVNPLLRPRQVAHILGDCGVRFLITTARRHAELGAILDSAPSLHRVLVVDEIPVPADARVVSQAFARPRPAPPPASRGTDELAAISTPQDPPVCRRRHVEPRQSLAGSRIVCRYLGIRDTERILSVLPFSFDYS